MHVDIPSTPDILRDDVISPRRRKPAYYRTGLVDRTGHQLPSPQRCIGSDSKSTSFAYDPVQQAYTLPYPERNMGKYRHESGSGSMEESEPLTQHDSTTETPNLRRSVDNESVSSVSTTSLVLEGFGRVPLMLNKPQQEFEYHDNDDDFDPELPAYMGSDRGRSMTKNVRRIVWFVSLVGVAGWAVALVLLLLSGK